MIFPGICFHSDSKHFLARHGSPVTTWGPYEVEEVRLGRRGDPETLLHLHYDKPVASTEEIFRDVEELGHNPQASSDGNDDFLRWLSTR